METCIYKEVWDQLNDYERTGWRQMLRHLPWVEEKPSHIMRGKLPDHLKAFYQFGVYTGGSMVVILDALEKAGKEINVAYGFDSFEGLPERTNEERDEVIEKHGEYLWSAGDYSSDELYGVEDSREFLQNVFDKYLSN